MIKIVEPNTIQIMHKQTSTAVNFISDQNSPNLLMMIWRIRFEIIAVKIAFNNDRRPAINAQLARMQQSHIRFDGLKQ